MEMNGRLSANRTDRMSQQHRPDLRIFVILRYYISGFGGLVVSMLASGTQDRGFKPGRNRRIFSGEKNPKHAFLRKRSKAVCPHVKEPCGLPWKSLNYPNISRTKCLQAYGLGAHGVVAL